MKSLVKILRGNIIAGMLVLLPVFTALYVATLLYHWIDTPVQETITLWLIGGSTSPDNLSVENRKALENGKTITVYKELFGKKGHSQIPVRVKKTRNGTYMWLLFPGFGIISTLILLFLAGLIARTLFGKMFIRTSEWLVSKIPAISTVYMATKQIGESLFSSGESRFREAVLVEYPRRGMYSIGFVTGSALKEFDQKAGEETLFVFLPTTPNPTSGFLLGVPKADCIFLNMSIEETVKLIISGGMIVPETHMSHHVNGASAGEALPEIPAEIANSDRSDNAAAEHDEMKSGDSTAQSNSDTIKTDRDQNGITGSVTDGQKEDER